jgi:hypothetical protein
VTVSSRLTGEIGSSSNPISGMTIATLLLTCLIFLIVGWTGSAYYVTALSVGAIVCIASSNGGSTSQDLKTGYLLGATPKYLQIAILFGSFASALVLGPMLLASITRNTSTSPSRRGPAGLHVDVSTLSKTETLHGPQSRDDPKDLPVWHKSDPAGGASEKYLVDDSRATPSGSSIPGSTDPRQPSRRDVGEEVQRPEGHADLLHHQGHPRPQAALVARPPRRHDRAVLEMSGVPSLAFAVGIYLPAFVLEPDLGGRDHPVAGGRLHPPQARRQEPDRGAARGGDRQEPRRPLASGYIAGGALAGIVIALLQGAMKATDDSAQQLGDRPQPAVQRPLRRRPLDALLLGLCVFLYLVGREVLLGPRSRRPERTMAGDREDDPGEGEGALAPLVVRAAMPDYDGALSSPAQPPGRATRRRSSRRASRP